MEDALDNVVIVAYCQCCGWLDNSDVQHGEAEDTCTNCEGEILWEVHQ